MSQSPTADRAEISAFAHLPRAFHVLLPEIAALPWHEESRADCANCVMTPAVSGEAPGSEWAFHPDGRCCTYHPALPNFLAGRALQSGGAAARKLTERISRGVGVSPWGVRPADTWRARYIDVASEQFGRQLTWRCPYWIGGEHACGIWQHRPGTCRTWYCKHDHGLHGAATWAHLQRILTHIEWLLAERCVAHGAPPVGATPQQAQPWLDWYRWCASHLESLDDAAVTSIADDALRSARTDLVTLKTRPPRRLPDVLVPAVKEFWHEPHGVRISGYSRYDTVIAPPSIFALLAQLDGTRTWREAQATILAQGDRSVTDDVIAELFRIGALEAPGSHSPTTISRRPWPIPDPDTP